MPNGVKQELSRLYPDVVGVTTPGALAAVLDIVPMSQLLFGTDYPFWPPDITVSGLARAGEIALRNRQLPCFIPDCHARESGHPVTIATDVRRLDRPLSRAMTAEMKTYGGPICRRLPCP